MIPQNVFFNKKEVLITLKVLWYKIYVILQIYNQRTKINVMLFNM